MQTMRQAVHIVGDVVGALPQVIDGAGDCRREPGIGAELIDFDRQQAEPLADVVVQFTPDPAPLLFLCVNQASGQILEPPGRRACGP